VGILINAPVTSRPKDGTFVLQAKVGGSSAAGVKRQRKDMASEEDGNKEDSNKRKIIIKS
jgi:hypothetical protein